MPNRNLLTALALVIRAAAHLPAAEPVAVERGGYQAAMTEDGLLISYQGAKFVCGSHLTLFKPGYTGSFYSQALGKARAQGQRLTMTDTIPEADGELTNEVELGDAGVTVSLRLRIKKEVGSCPCEYAAAMFPPEVFAGGEYSLMSSGHLQHLYSYVIPRIMWKPDQDLRRLVDDFTKAWYGRAWKPMRQYVEALHQGAMSSKSEGVMDCHAGPGQRFFRELFTALTVAKLYRMFESAEKQAESDVIRRRIAAEKWGLLFTDLFLHGRASSDVTPDASEQGYHVQTPTAADYPKIGELLRLTQLLNRSWVVAQHAGFSLSNIIGFEPTASPWWNCPKVKALMEDPAAAYDREARTRSRAIG